MTRYCCATKIAGFVFAALTLFSSAALASHGSGNSGNEFIFSFMPNHPSDTPNVEVHLTSEVAVEVLVEYPVNAPTFSQTVSITPGVIAIVALPVEADRAWTANTVLNNSVRLSAPDPFVAYFVNRFTFSSDAAVAVPVAALNNEYIIATYDSLGPDDAAAQFAVTAAYDNTTVTITPTQQLTGGGGAAGVPFQVTLNRGEGYLVQDQTTGNNGGLTGSIVTSDKPVAVTNGQMCANVPTDRTACDTLFEMAQPVQSWGNDALVANLPLRTGGSIYRVLASEDNTTVSIDGAPATSTHAPAGPAINRGQFLEIGPIAGNHLISADKPIFVVQYMTGQSSPGASTGDPAMGNMIPPEQYTTGYTFSTVGGSQFAQHFLTIIANTTDAGLLLLDGVEVQASSYTEIAGTSFSVAVLPLAEGTHVTSSARPHGITVEGYNSFDSYLYPGGMLLRPINPRGDSNPPICNLDPFDPFGPTASGTGVDNRPTEDTDGNGFLNGGEDINGNGQIDRDTGIFFIELLPGSVNLRISNITSPQPGQGSSPFVPGVGNISYTAEAIDPGVPSSGTVRITDGAGNSCDSTIFLSVNPPPKADSNPPSCPAEPFAAGADVAFINGLDNRPSEDINGNGFLDAGEDLNGNGIIDDDLGIVQVELLPGSLNLILAAQPFNPGAASLRYGVELINTGKKGSGIIRITDGGGNTCETEVTLNGECDDGGDPNLLDVTALHQRDGILRTADRLRRRGTSRQRSQMRRILATAENAFQANWVTANQVPLGAGECLQARSDLCSLQNLEPLRTSYEKNATQLFDLTRRAISLLQQTGTISAREARRLRTHHQQKLNRALEGASRIPAQATICSGKEEPSVAGISSIGGKPPPL